MRVHAISSVTELRRWAAAWDDLWWRSPAYLPTQRAELVAQWWEHFAPGQPLQCLAVEHDGQWVAALPLVGTRKMGWFPIGKLTANCWSDSGTLLWDPDAPPEAMTRLAERLRDLPWPLVLLEEVALDEPCWQALREALACRGIPVHQVPQYPVGLIDITHDWDGYVRALSSNHRSAVRRTWKRLQQEGDVQLEQYVEIPPDRLETLLHQAWQIEDRSWKGEAGTSVARIPGMDGFFLRQARQLVQWNQLELLFLCVRRQRIAFEYCYVAKGVTASHKIGYDPRFKEYGPGRLLRWLQLERYFADPSRRLFDTLGILCEAKARWCTRSYAVSRMVVATSTPVARAALFAYARIWRHLRTLLRRHAAVAPPPLGATAALASRSAAASGCKPAAAANPPSIATASRHRD